MRNRIGLPLLLLLFVGSDADSKEYIIAPIPGTAACVEVCEATRMQCRDAIDSRAGQCKFMYRQLKSEYDRCISMGGTSGRCQKPKRCPVKRSSKCKKPYDKCFIACGGRIE